MLILNILLIFFCKFSSVLIYAILAPFGRRGWNMMYGRLCGLVLYLDKNDSSKNKRSRFVKIFLLKNDFYKKENFF